MPYYSVLLCPQIRGLDRALPIKPINASGVHQSLRIPVRQATSTTLPGGHIEGALVAEPLGLYDGEDDDYPSQGGLQLQVNSGRRENKPHAPYSGHAGLQFTTTSASAVIASGDQALALVLVGGYRSGDSFVTGDTRPTGDDDLSYSALTGQFTLLPGVYMVDMRYALNSATLGTVCTLWLAQPDTLADGSVITSSKDTTKYCQTTTVMTSTDEPHRMTGLLYIASSPTLSSTVELHVNHNDSSSRTITINYITINRIAQLTETPQA